MAHWEFSGWFLLGSRGKYRKGCLLLYLIFMSVTWSLCSPYGQLFQNQEINWNFNVSIFTDVSHIITIIIIITCWALQFARHFTEITSFYPHKSPVNLRLILSHHTEVVHMAQTDTAALPGSYTYTAELKCSTEWSSSWNFVLTSTSHIKTPIFQF